MHLLIFHSKRIRHWYLLFHIDSKEEEEREVKDIRQRYKIDFNAIINPTCIVPYRNYARPV